MWDKTLFVDPRGAGRRSRGRRTFRGEAPPIETVDVFGRCNVFFLPLASRTSFCSARHWHFVRIDAAQFYRGKLSTELAGRSRLTCRRTNERVPPGQCSVICLLAVLLLRSKGANFAAVTPPTPRNAVPRCFALLPCLGGHVATSYGVRHGDKWNWPFGLSRREPPSGRGGDSAESRDRATCREAEAFFFSRPCGLEGTRRPNFSTPSFCRPRTTAACRECGEGPRFPLDRDGSSGCESRKKRDRQVLVAGENSKAPDRRGKKKKR